jgi:hypothetical protein
MPRVRIGTCTGPADAALVKSAFEAHEIPVFINAEQHASMLGGLGGVFVPLHIFVEEDFAEEAAELLRDLREQDHTQEAHDDATEIPGDTPDDDSADLAAARTDRRRRIGILMLISFGGVFAVPFVIGRPILGVGLALAVIVLIAITLGRPKPQAIPTARVTREKK